LAESRDGRGASGRILPEQENILRIEPQADNFAADELPPPAVFDNHRLRLADVDDPARGGWAAPCDDGLRSL
jgi:hypothetical protein